MSVILCELNFVCSAMYEIVYYMLNFYLSWICCILW